MLDWPVLLNYLAIGLVAAIGAISAAYARRAANNPTTVVAAPAVPLALIDRVPVQPGVLPGGGSHEIAATILPWFPASYIPAWSQNRGVLPTGDPDWQAQNDCGETCVAMCVAGVWGCPVEPGSIRQYLNGPQGSGLTDGAALVRALHYYSVSSHVELVNGLDAWARILAVVASQRCVIMLGRWPTPGLALHWMVAVSDGADVVQYVNPWNGARSFLAKADWLGYESGQLVMLDSHLHFDCRTWPDPS